MSPKEKNSNNKSRVLIFPHIYVIEASAGSGKTKSLASRYVDFLLRYHNQAFIPFTFRNILAVTFTNEAADQMKQEILSELKIRALAKNKDSSASMGIVDEIIRNFSDFSVCTIDSFVHRILVASSLELKLPPEYEIMSQPRGHLEYVLDEFLEDILFDESVKDLFSEFLRHFLVVEGQKYWNPKKVLLDMLGRFYREENARAKYFSAVSENCDLWDGEQQLKIKVKKLAGIFSGMPNVNKRFLKSFCSLLETAGIDFLKGINRYINKPLAPGEGILNKDQKKPLQSQQNGNIFKPRQELCDSWDDFSAHSLKYIRAFVWLRYSVYLKIFSSFRCRLENYKEEKRIVFLEELNRKARQLLASGGVLPVEIYYKLSAVLYHYLIDEFQDTSVLQWENVESLVEDALSKGGSLFYVGDKKQAIYRFRGGEVELFDLIKDRFKNQVSKIYEDVLSCNYRSREQIVKFSNFVFSQRNLAEFLNGFGDLSRDYREKILSVFRDSLQQPARDNALGGFIRLEAIQGDNKECMQDNLNDRLRKTIDELSERFNYRDILILVRDNQEVVDVSTFLLQQGFPVCSSRTISIRHNYLIRQIIALLKFLNSPVDNLSFANFILGEIFTKATRLSEDVLHCWLEKLRSEGIGSLYTQFRLKYADIWQSYLQYLFSSAGFLPVYELVEVILNKFNVEENFPDISGFKYRLLEIINDLQEQGKNSLSDFLEWFELADEEELFVSLPAGLDAIRIFTIHKAKGLASKVVILPYAAIDIKVADTAKIVHENEEGLYLLYLQKDIWKNQSDLAAIYEKEYYHTLLDELNCVYVALTRAADELYIFLPFKVNRRQNQLIPFLFGEASGVFAEKEIGERILDNVKFSPALEVTIQESNPLEILPEKVKNIFKEQLFPFRNIIPVEKQHLVNRGNVLHFLLREIDPVSFLKDASLYITKIKDTCRLFNYSYSEEIIHDLTAIFNNPEIGGFSQGALEVMNEKEIVDMLGNLRRIDKLIVKEDKVLIVDYKSGEEFIEEHQEQIKDYAGIIKGIYTDKKCEGWLIYLDSKETRYIEV